MRHRRPDSNRKPGASAIGVRISRSIWCRTLPPNGGSPQRPRRGARAVLLTAFAVQVIHRINRHQIAINEVLDHARDDWRELIGAYSLVVVCTLDSIHSITSSRL
jgi:hypothetical protein